jgi:MFS family permease
MDQRCGVESGQTRQPKIWNRVYTCVFISNALLFLGMQMVNTLVSKYADYLGATAAIVGIVSSLFAFTALFFKLFSGPAIDSFNRKYILMAAIFVIALSFFGFGISGTVEMLFIFRLVQGCGQAFTATCCLALAADSLPPNKFGVGIGTFTLAQAVCQAIGPALGLMLTKHIGYNLTFVIAGCCALCAILAASLINISYKKTSVFLISLNRIAAKEAAIPAVLLFFLQMTFSNINAFLILFADKRQVTNIGFFYTVYAVTMLIVPRTIGKLLDRWGAVRAIFPALLFFALSFFIISISSSLMIFLLAAVVSALGYGAAQPVVQTLCMKSVPETRRGTASGTSYIGQDLGNLAGPIIAGVIVEQFGYEIMWRLMILPVLIAMVLIFLFHDGIHKIEQNFKERETSGCRIKER